jgi:glutathione S-transferase
MANKADELSMYMQGPFFFGENISLPDINMLPMLERMVASLVSLSLLSMVASLVSLRAWWLLW